MADRQDFDVVREEIEAYPMDKLINSPVPADNLAKETEMVHSWMQADLEGFLQRNFTQQHIDRLPRLCGALRYLEAEWANRRLMQADALKEYHALAPVAEDLLDDCLAEMDLAFDGDDDLCDIVSSIREGNDQADFVLDFPRTVDLARKHPAPLEAINFDFAKLDELEKVGDQLAALMGASDAEKLSKSSEKALRDKAYSLLTVTVRRIRKCGKIINRKNPDRLIGYISQYTKAVNARTRGKDAGAHAAAAV